MLKARIELATRRVSISRSTNELQQQLENGRGGGIRTHGKEPLAPHFRFQAGHLKLLGHSTFKMLIQLATDYKQSLRSLKAPPIGFIFQFK